MKRERVYPMRPITSWLGLLILPYVVSVSSVPSENCVYPESWACPQIATYYVGGFGPIADKQQAEDLAACLNMGREHRIKQPRIRTTDSGDYPCCEDSHQGIACMMCDSQ